MGKSFKGGKRLGWCRHLERYKRLGCKRRRGNIDLGGDMSMEVQEYDTRHGAGRLKGPGGTGALGDAGGRDQPGTGQ